MPVAVVVSPPELCRGTDAPVLATTKQMGPSRDAPAAGAGARVAAGYKQHQAKAPASAPPPHVSSSSAASAALAARDQLLVAGATPESSFLALLVEEVLLESRPDYAALLPLASAAAEAIGKALAEAPSCPVPASAVAGLAAALGGAEDEASSSSSSSSLLSRLRFAPPTKPVHLTGSAPLRAALPPLRFDDSDPSSLLIIDVAAEVPRSIFDEKDFKRGRYLVRRAAWLQGAKAALEKAVAKDEKKSQKKEKSRSSGSGSSSSSKPSSVLEGAALSWTDLDGDARRPCLLVSLPRAPPAGGVSLRIVPSAPSELAAAWLPRLAPDRGNLGGGGVGGEGAEVSSPPSPRYNATVVADFFPDAELEDLRLALEACPAAADGVTLVGLWARAQRLSLSCSSSSSSAASEEGDTAAAPLLSPRALAAAAASAASAGRLARAMSALQAARAIWREVEAAAGKGYSPRFGESWEVSPVAAAASAAPAATVLSSPSLPPPHASYPRPPPVSSFIKNGNMELVVLSCGGHLNLAAAGAGASSATAAAGRRVAAAAAAAVAALDAARGAGGDPEGCVEALWLRRRCAPWLGDYDAFWRVRVPLVAVEKEKEKEGGAKKKRSTGAAATPAAISSVFSASAPPLSGDCPASSALESRVEAIARAALGGRVTEVRAVPRPRLRSHPSEGPAVAPLPSTSISSSDGNASFSFVTLAGRANPSAFSRRADLGPPADSGRAAAAFRAFWGELSDLRRFGDGAIREAVVWGGGGNQSLSSSSPAAAADAALAAAMRRHAGPGAAAAGLTDSLEPALAERGSGSGGGSGGAREQQQQQSQSQSAALSSSAALDAALAKLSKALRGLPGALSSAGGGEEAANGGECGVALRPVGVAATSASLGRRTAPFPPAPHPLLLALQQQQQQGNAAASASSSSRGRKGSGNGNGVSSSISLLPSTSVVVPRTLPAVEVAVQLEGSGRWPQDAAAAAKMKAALACQLADRLEGDYGFRARAFEVDAAADSSGGGGGGGGGGFDVFVDGFAFRCLLWSPRDDAAVTAAKARERAAARAAAARAAAAAKSNSAAALLATPPPTTTTAADAAALRSYCDLRDRIDHAAALAAVAGVSPGFSRGGRLLVRWAGAHLLLPPPVLQAAAKANAQPPPPSSLVPALELVAAAAAGPRLAGGSGSGLCPPPSASAANANGGGPCSSSSFEAEGEEEALLRRRAAAAAAGSAAAPPSTALAVFAAALRLLADKGRRFSSAECGGEGASRPLLLVDPLGQMGASERARALRGEEEEDDGGGGDLLSRRQRQRQEEEQRKRKASSSASSSPPLALASAIDPSGTLWTRGIDHASVLRLSRLAQRALAGMEAALLSGGGGASAAAFDALPRPPRSSSPPPLLEAAFAPALADWDALIWLKPSALPAGGKRAPARLSAAAAAAAAPPGRPGRLPADGSAGRCGAAIASLPATTNRGGAPTTSLADELLVGFDPVACFVRALQARFGLVASFGCDGAGGESAVVGVRWMPGARRAWPPGASGPLAQAATLPTATVTASSSSLPLVLSVELDEEATLAAMCAAGGGIADGFSVVRPLKKREKEEKNEEKKMRRRGSSSSEEEEEEKSHRLGSKARRRL